jgi:hypothetical protein
MNFTYEHILDHTMPQKAYSSKNNIDPTNKIVKQAIQSHNSSGKVDEFALMRSLIL